jgi:hypothetical protein
MVGVVDAGDNHVVRNGLEFMESVRRYPDRGGSGEYTEMIVAAPYMHLTLNNQAEMWKFVAVLRKHRSTIGHRPQLAE